MIQKLSCPKDCAVMLRASMYNYGTISQCVFSIHSIIDPTFEQQAISEPSTQNLEPNTPKKHAAKAAYTAESSTNNGTMEEDAPVAPLKNKQKKE